MRARLNVPGVALGFSVDDGRKISANAKIVTAEEPENVGNGRPTPGKIQRGGPQPRRCSAQATGKVDHAGSLQHQSRARGGGFEIDAPSSGAVRLEISGYVDEGEGNFFVFAFEINAPGIDFKARETNIPSWRRGVRCWRIWSLSIRHGISGRRGTRQPFRKIPIPRRVAYEVQAGPGERDGAEFHVAAQQAWPPQAHGERFSAQKIFVAETRIFRKGHPLRFQRGSAPQAEIIAADLHGPAENTLQPSGDSLLKARVSDQQGNSGVGQPEKDQQKGDELRQPRP